MNTKRSRGSVVGFVVVGVLLLALIAGGVYAVKRGVFNGTSEPQIAKNEEKTSKRTDDTSSKNAESSNSTTNQSNDQSLSEALKKQAADEKKAKEQQSATSNNPSTSTGSSSQTNVGSSATPSPQTTPVAGSTDSSKLPHTGPAEDAVVAALGAALLLGTGIAYTRSRALI